MSLRALRDGAKSAPPQGERFFPISAHPEEARFLRRLEGLAMTDHLRDQVV